jgi:hypothetical protein
MNRWLALGVIAMAANFARAEETPDAAQPPVNKVQIDAALELTSDEAGKYSFVIGGDAGRAVKLQAEPILRWSNPAVGEVHGNVFLWTNDARPAAVGSLFKWFTPHTHTSHEFHSLTEASLVGRYDGREVWSAANPGVSFAPLASAPLRAATAAQRLLQMKRLAKDFAATKHERDGAQQELRLLTQPIYRYAAPAQELLDGALFVFVQGTDPEVFLLLEARGREGQEAWQFALARMNGVGFNVRYQDREVWSVEAMPWRDIGSHAEAYTSFRFEMP